MSEQHSEQSAWIIEASDATFERDVVQRSHDVPVVVDFWAAWCQPCRLLAHVLEKLAREYDGRFLLVKANTDDTPQAAAAFGVQSIPCVYALRDGQAVDSFVGVLSEDQLRSWIDRLLPSEGELLVADARSLEGNDPAAAEAKYHAAIKLSADDAAPKIALARLLLKQERVAESRQLIEELEARGFLETEAEDVKAALEVHRRGAETGGVESCRAGLAADPDNGQLQLNLASALAAAEQFQESLDLCLDLVRRDKQGIGQPAKQLMLDVFRVLPDGSELLTEYRRQLSAALY